MGGDLKMFDFTILIISGYFILPGIIGGVVKLFEIIRNI